MSTWQKIEIGMAVSAVVLSLVLRNWLAAGFATCWLMTELQRAGEAWLAQPNKKSPAEAGPECQLCQRSPLAFSSLALRGSPPPE